MTPLPLFFFYRGTKGKEARVRKEPQPLSLLRPCLGKGLPTIPYYLGNLPALHGLLIQGLIVAGIDQPVVVVLIDNAKG
jgi:hypothetical protein